MNYMYGSIELKNKKKLKDEKNGRANYQMQTQVKNE